MCICACNVMVLFTIMICYVILCYVILCYNIVCYSIVELRYGCMRRALRRDSWMRDPGRKRFDSFRFRTSRQIIGSVRFGSQNIFSRLDAVRPAFFGRVVARSGSVRFGSAFGSLRFQNETVRFASAGSVRCLIPSWRSGAWREQQSALAVSTLSRSCGWSSNCCFKPKMMEWQFYSMFCLISPRIYLPRNRGLRLP